MMRDLVGAVYAYCRGSKGMSEAWVRLLLLIRNAFGHKGGSKDYNRSLKGLW